MRQQVNLLSADLLPAREWLTFNQFAGVVGATVLALGLTSAAQGARHAYLTAALVTTQQQVAALQTDNAAQRLAREADPEVRSLLASLAALAVEREHDERLLAVVGDRHAADAGGFAGYFEALARNHEAGLWLSKVAIDANSRDIELAGTARDAEEVPAWLGRLRVSPAFATSVFSGLVLTAAPVEDEIGFSVRGNQ